ncbi:MAG: prepilin-type N-terminal cleavage/methylation domain-containing protein [Kiritimatiellae bacterium]|nr:prepilin-type N-terminal cleavage/methylation domain-containing protein [Kiritimatiellia bacterium]
MNNPTQTQRCAGFTLMEVALSIAVVAIGIMALFALMSSGLESSAEALADTQSAIFADNVFGGLRAISTDLARSGVGNWEFFWNDFQTGQTNLLVAMPQIWEKVKINPLKLGTPQVLGDDIQHTLKYINIPIHSQTTSEVMNHVLRYQLKVESRRAGLFTDILNWDVNIAEVTLKVWGGEFGSWQDEDAIIFYTEIDNPGDL